MTTQVSHLFEQLKAHYDEIVSIRRHLHKYPELSFEETNTSRFIAAQLRNLGVAVRERVGGM